MGFESDLASRYIWRGLAFSSGFVDQNSIFISKGNISTSIWSNYDFSAEGERPHFNEFDFAIEYEIAFKRLGISPSIQSYYYPNQKDSPATEEMIVNLSYDAPILQPFMIHSFDINKYRGSYFAEFGLRSNWDIGERISIEPAAEIGWATAKFNEVYIGKSGAALDLASFEVNVTWHITNFIYLKPHLITTHLLNSEIRAVVKEPTLFQFGLVIGYEY